MNENDTGYENPYKPPEAEIPGDARPSDDDGYRTGPLYFETWKRTFDFQGRSRRREYWVFYLINLVIYYFLFYGVEWLVLGWVFGLVYTIPSLAVRVRRMHDTNRSGWWILVPIANLVFTLLDGNKGPNSFGPDPKNRISDLDPESMEARSPVKQEATEWVCRFCNTKNASNTVSCTTCGKNRWWRQGFG